MGGVIWCTRATCLGSQIWESKKGGGRKELACMERLVASLVADLPINLVNQEDQ